MSIRAIQIQEITSQVRETVTHFESQQVSNEGVAVVAFDEWCEAFSDFDIPNAAAEFERAFPRLAWSL